MNTALHFEEPSEKTIFRITSVSSETNEDFNNIWQITWGTVWPNKYKEAAIL